MSDVFFDQLDIQAPSLNLNIGSGAHGEQTGRMLIELERAMLHERPSVVLVYGDTNSTLAAALAASKLQLPVVHIEAGLRSYNRRMPEEINRVLTDHISRRLYAPTETAVANLHREGIAPELVRCVGDVMYDAALHATSRARSPDVLLGAGIKRGAYILATVHRAENTNDLRRLRNIMGALADVARDIPVVFPLHPRTRGILDALEIDRPVGAERLTIIDPVGFLEMIALERDAHIVVTDSGGVQKEAYFQRKLCVTLRDETEWVELVSTGWNRLASPDSKAAMVEAIRRCLGSTLPVWTPLYGDGRAGERIVEDLVQHFSN